MESPWKLHFLFLVCMISLVSLSSAGRHKVDDPCDDIPCVHGICESLTLTCNCYRGYTGELCDTDIDECSGNRNPCHNGGACINDPGTYSCDCTGTGYSGDNCETIITCNKPPTIEYGEIIPDQPTVDYEEAYAYRCIEGYALSGTDMRECQADGSLGGSEPTCENIDDCPGDPPCANGVCIDGINDKSCDCSYTGFDGTLCENDLCDNPESCIHGDCHHDTTVEIGYVCDCYHPWTGAHCETHIASLSRNRRGADEHWP